MKKVLCVFCSLLMFIFNINLAFAASAPRTSDFDSGISVPVYFITTVNSDYLNAGDLISFVVAEDVYEYGNLVFKKDTNGYATVDSVVHSAGHGKAGAIKISKGKITDVYGNPRMVQLIIDEKGLSRKASAITLSVVGVLVILIPFGIWRKGDPAIVSSSKIINASILR